MFIYLKELFSFHELLFTWTKRDFMIRYSQSVLGIAWAIIQPFSLMVIFSIIFSIFIRVPTENIPYPIFAYTALLPWTFFANSLNFAIPSLINNMSMISKIYFPREIFPLSAILVCFVDFVIAATIYIVMMIYFKIQLHWIILLYPVILVTQMVFTFGISLAASAFMVFFRDMRFIIPLILQIWMYASPIIYPVSLVPEKLQPLYFLNPMAIFIDSYRKILLLGEPPNWIYLCIAVVISFFTLFISYRYFKKAEQTFADII